MSTEPTTAQPPATPAVHEYSDSHAKKLILGALLVFIALLLALGIWQYLESQRGARAIAYTTATTLDQYQSVAETYAGTIEGGNALLRIGDLHFDSDEKSARASLEQFVADYPQHPRLVQGKLALAQLFEREDKLDKAEEAYRSLIFEYPDSELAPYILLRQAHVARYQDKKLEAVDLLERLITEYPGNPFIPRVQPILDELRPTQEEVDAETAAQETADSDKKQTPKDAAKEKPASSKKGKSEKGATKKAADSPAKEG